MKKIGIIGYGNMGSAIAERLKRHYEVSVFEKDAQKVAGLAGIQAAGSAQELVAGADAVILAVKPQDFSSLLEEIKGEANGKLIISIAAGKTTKFIEEKLKAARVVRAMPNICAKIGEAESSLCKGRNAGQSDLDFAIELFKHIGVTWVVAEEMMNAATAITGSGPAYVYYDMEKNNIAGGNLPEEVRQSYIQRLSEAARRVGFEPRLAFELASSTVASSISLSVRSGVSPAELRRQVTSKGGTTEAAIKVLESGGSWADAAEAAVRRAAELLGP